MKTSEWKRLVRAVQPADSEWAFRRDICYRVPVRHFLFGVGYETSRDPDYIFVERLSQPLFIPASHVSGGERVDGPNGTFVSIQEEALADAIRRAFEFEYDEETELRRLIRQNNAPISSARVERAAYSEILLGLESDAAKRIQGHLAGPVADDREFVVRQRERLKTILRALERGRDGALEQLERWTAGTCGALGLQRSA